MKNVVCFIRHGQTAINNLKRIQGRKNYELNETGREQAKKTGLYLKKINEHFDVIYSSPLDRAFETASIIKNCIGFDKDIIKDESFIERDFGKAEDMPITDWIFNFIKKDEVEGLEKSFEIQKRVSDGVRRVCKDNPGKRILIVAHAHTIKALLTYLDKNRTFTDPLMNCSMSYFTVEDGNISIDKVNIIP